MVFRFHLVIFNQYSTRYNLAKEECIAMTGLAEDSSIAIKPADKGSCVIAWNGTDYLLEA